MEVGVVYIEGIPHAPFLLTMAFLKIALVLLYFMHLRYDSKWFSFIFFIPFVLVIPFVIVLLIELRRGGPCSGNATLPQVQFPGLPGTPCAARAGRFC